MKNFYFAFVFFLSFSVTQAQWVWQNPLPSGNTLNSVSFISSTIAYAIGDAGTVLKSADGGITWNILSVGTINPLLGVDFFDENNGIIVGADETNSRGLILRTTDGGNTWIEHTYPAFDYYFYSISFIDLNNAIAVGNQGSMNGIIIKTTDGGVTWSEQTFPFMPGLLDVTFTDMNNATAVGYEGTIIRTTDGGINWFQQVSGTTNHLTGVYFWDGNNGTVIGNESTILKTTDGGTNWIEQSTNITAGFRDVYFTDQDNGIIVGSDGSNGLVIRTTDGGTNWADQNIGTRNWLTSISFIDANNGLVVGEFGEILRTTDGGSNWVSQLQGVTQYLYDVCFSDINNGTAVGEQGTILRTTNGGTTWLQQTSGSSVGLLSVSFTDDNNGFAVGEQGTILRTTNAGTSWEQQFSGTSYNLRGVSFSDVNNGSAVGDWGIILRTTNGGSNWVQQTNPSSNWLTAVCFIDANNGTAVGNNYIINTTNGGNTWELKYSGLNDRYFFSVSMIDVNNIIAVGGPSGRIFKSTDGGTTWFSLNIGFPSSSLTDISFTDSNNGIVVGGGIYRTTDGGISWTEEKGSYNATAVHLINPNYAWVAGSYGTILKYRNNTPTLSLISPAGGEKWSVGSVQNILWSSYNIVNVRLEYSTDDGQSWITIIDSTPSDGSFSWTIPNTPSTQCIIRISDFDNSSILAMNLNKPFDIISNSSNWIVQNIGTNHMLRDVSFSDVNNGTAIGGSGIGLIFRTTDGGQNWVQQEDGTNQTLIDVCFTDINYGTVVGYNGTILRTTDGGTNWIPQTSGTIQHLESIDFIDINNGWIVGNGGTILRTSDGGANWIPQSSGTTNDLFGIDFTDINHGVAVGRQGIILMTTDGGNNWNTITTEINSFLESIFFIDPNNGIAVGYDELNYLGLILRTTDGGLIWSKKTIGSTLYLLDVCFTDMNNGWIVGDGGTILRTTNGGTTWYLEPSGTNEFLFAISFTDNNHGIIVGDFGTVLRYKGVSLIPSISINNPNGGEWWKTGWNRDITWSSENVSNVNLYYSSDNGINWNTISSNIASATGSYEWHIPLLNNFIEANCRVKIEDASNSAYYDLSDNPFYIWHPWGVTKRCNLGQQIVDFLETNVDISLEASTSNDITVTYYPGESPVTSELPSEILVISDYYWQVSAPDVSFNNGKMIIPLSTLRGVTDATKLSWLKRSNPGDPWENIGGIVNGDNFESTVLLNTFSEFAIGSSDLVNPLPVELSSFTAVRGSEKVILNWETKTEVNNYGFEVERNTPLYPLSRGEAEGRGVWKKIGFVEGNGNSNSPKEYSFTDKNLIGGNKFQYRLKQIDNDGKYTYSDIVEINFIPTEFALYQNYPNPFNPVTKIRYQLPKESKVTIMLYDILGSEIREILSEQKEAGVYELEFKASNLPSGAYIYRMFTGDFNQAKKMMIMK